MINFDELKSKYENDKFVIDISGEIVHVVTHSNIMKKYLKNKYNVDIKSSWFYFSSNPFEKYEKSNNWSFIDIRRTNPNEITKGNIIEQLKFKIGVPAKHENRKYDIESCDIKGENICQQQQGGKKTKKKRKIKKTHKKKNAHKKRKTQNKRKN